MGPIVYIPSGTLRYGFKGGFMNGDRLVPVDGCEACRRMMEPGELGKMKFFYIDTSGHMMMSGLLCNLRRDFDLYGDLPVQYFTDGGVLNFKHPA